MGKQRRNGRVHSTNIQDGESIKVVDVSWKQSKISDAKLSSDISVAEPSNLMPHRSACLPLDTKHSRKNTKLLDSVRHPPGENPKIHIFAIRITNEIIKLTSFLTISYITLIQHQSKIFIIITAEYNHIIRV